MGLGNANHLSPGEVRIFGRSHDFQWERKELYNFDCQLTANEGGGRGVGIRILQSLMGNQVNFLIIQPSPPLFFS